MGVLDELLNDGETFSFADNGEQENFRLPVRGIGKVGGWGRPMATQVAQHTTIPQANAQNPFMVGQRAGIPSAKAQFDITIKRLRPIRLDGNTAGSDFFNEDLQVILFQSSQIKSHYKKSLSYSGNATYLGVDGGNIINPNVQLPNYRFDGHRFIYLTKSNVDPNLKEYVQILITCPQIDYTTLLSALESDIIRINYIKYFVPSANESVQFNKRFEFIETSQFGKKSNDSVPVLSNIKSNDFKDRLIEIPVNFYVDKTKGLLLDVAPELTDKEIVLSLFVDYTNRQSM